MLACKGGGLLLSCSFQQFNSHHGQTSFSTCMVCTLQVSFSSEFTTPRHIKILITLVKDYFDIEGTRLGNVAYIIRTGLVCHSLVRRALESTTVYSYFNIKTIANVFYFAGHFEGPRK